jgi:hypothetical protein
MGWIIPLGIVGIVFILAALGVAPWLAIVPVVAFAALLVFVVPALAARERSGGGIGSDRSVPSTREASYEPVTDPSER